MATAFTSTQTNINMVSSSSNPITPDCKTESLRQKQARLALLRQKAITRKNDLNLSPTATSTPDSASSAEESSNSNSSSIYHRDETMTITPIKLSLGEEATTAATTPVKSLSKSQGLRQRLRKQEAQIAMLRRRSTLRAQSSNDAAQVVLTTSDASATDQQDTTAAIPSGVVVNSRTQELLMMTARKKKEVAGRKRHFSNVEMQNRTTKALKSLKSASDSLEAVQ
mmetsp:Transcript_15831/g.20670  ORF Transcript_15831/g.20670 Transcript_15831/m.20670 type:complete len:225 (+) Transcript_15831:115-789(+)|eukprot:CAMPEP_0198139474 /NCGR_PEP_ID=MMETSP1443-20131203/2753_1 /TAXON_ID=186043 /ORGANISM="Entomoneis sp., Strain CCMP2396" /LENGTH=224 /DNA_ID=CAMNT_0043801599 /DNA_START=126 /DNA_END=800 /DNA_ORIENTATION=+